MIVIIKCCLAQQSYFCLDNKHDYRDVIFIINSYQDVVFDPRNRNIYAKCVYFNFLIRILNYNNLIRVLNIIIIDFVTLVNKNGWQLFIVNNNNFRLFQK